MVRLNFPPNWFTVPRFYTSNPLNMTGPDAEIAWPGFAESLDYELELTVVLGVGGKDIAASRHRGIAGTRPHLRCHAVQRLHRTRHAGGGFSRHVCPDEHLRARRQLF